MITLELTESQLDHISDALYDNLKEYFEEIHESYADGQPPAVIRTELQELYDLAKMLDIKPFDEDKQWLDEIL